MNRSSKTKSRKRVGRPASILQRLASTRNWLQGFVLKKFHLPYSQLDFSIATRIQLDLVNQELTKLKELVDEDWKAQAVRIREDKEKDYIPF